MDAPHTEFDATRPNYVPCAEAMHRIRQGWLAQFRGPGSLGSFGALIRLGQGGCPHTHSAMLERTPDGIDVLELRELYGGRALPLWYHTKTYPGIIDVFSPNSGGRWPAWDPDGAVRVMRNLVTRGYGYRSVLRVALRHLPFVWRLYPVDTTDICIDERNKGIRPFCSHAVALACQLGGRVDPVPRLPDYLTTPAHLTWSLFYRYEFSIAAPTAEELAAWQRSALEF